MKTTRKAFLIIFTFIVIVLLSNISFAAPTATYYDNGNPSSITVDEGTIRYYENGNVSSITTENGTASYNEDGSIISIVGTPAISLDEAKAEFDNLKKQQSNNNTTNTNTVNTNTANTVTSDTEEVTENMPSTGVENYIYIFIVIAVIGVIFATYKYISLKKDLK